MNEKQVILDAMKKNVEDNGYFLCLDQHLFDSATGLPYL
jgi:hypothetical protein